ncbi:MAG: polyhydroxyalkanoate synthesis regulator DNA-binding domain-containing protein [Myxococcota bacterium]
MITVKKYANRRLYDTDQSRYVTLDELAERIRTGSDVRVVDAKTGADLTQPVLAQIIFESRGASKMLPAGFLAQLIRMDDADVALFMSRYLTWALEMYLQAKATASHLGPLSPLAQAPFQATSALARLLGGLGPSFGMPPVRLPGTAMQAPQPVELESGDDELKALREEIASLRKLVEGAAE